MEQTVKIKAGPKDVFLQIAIAICLYMAVWNILTLFFAVIDQAFPDQANPVYYSDAFSGTIRFAIASLIIVFPLMLVLARIVQKDFFANPEKREMRLRKWITYLNLFLSGATIAISLITLLNSFLAGEITIHFILKIIATVAVAAIVFSYFITDVRHGDSFSNKARAAYLSTGGAIVVIGIILGFMTTGSPFTARLRRFDQTRVQDLQNIQSQVLNYWQQKGTLPADAASLTDSISGYSVPKDPEGKDYAYSVTEKNTFKICAAFDLADAGSAASGINRVPVSPQGVSYGIQNTWQHEAGEQCFDRTIDPQLYPVRKQ